LLELITLRVELKPTWSFRVALELD
jgi:hypothetical protein